MNDFPKRDLRLKILLALAGLLQEHGHNFFLLDKICEWLEARKKYFGNVSEISISRKLKKMREKNKITVLTESGKKLGKIPVLEMQDKKRPYSYKIGSSTAESRFTAKLLRILKESCPAGSALPKELEEKIVGEIFKEFKDEHNLSNLNEVSGKIGDAIKGLYFIREEGLLRPTRRILIDEREYIEYLSEPLPPPDPKSTPEQTNREET